ncbi:MAG: tRNA (adenosine(37)-N6)-dimethylallyltransferase MiaA [Comamonadaceae bacterium]|nr:MAG: tRNA (adenosine(37)-N6)-dimethylallyltransferase MiaA [Comamonadaceae bacterium]
MRGSPPASFLFYLSLRPGTLALSRAAALFASPAYIALAGPTASGKTAGALALADALAPHLPVEIVSVDSALVYRSMDIGTAKPTPGEQARAPHHLIDIRDPVQAYSAAEFVQDATRLIAEIRARGALPLLVGGTMLYFKALADGIDDMPAADPAVRAMLESQAAEHGWPALHAELARVDPVTAARLAPADSQRIQRALEVWHVSGKPLSHFHTARKTADGTSHPAGAAALFSLEPSDRAWLHARIAQRFDAMLQGGFIDEVRALRARGDLHLDLPSMRCVGYRQAWEALDHEAATGAFALPDLRERGVAATRQLAKRQITWLRSMPQRHTIACDAPDATVQLVRAVTQCLSASTSTTNQPTA